MKYLYLIICRIWPKKIQIRWTIIESIQISGVNDQGKEGITGVRHTLQNQFGDIKIVKHLN